MRWALYSHQHFLRPRRTSYLARSSEKRRNFESREIVTIIMVIMVSLEEFEIIYSPIIKQHLKTIEPKYYSLIRKSLETGLPYQPDVEAKNRRPLKRPVVFRANWELRFGPDNRFRAFYQVEHDKAQVILLAIGQKVVNRLFIGGEEVEI